MNYILKINLYDSTLVRAATSKQSIGGLGLFALPLDFSDPTGNRKSGFVISQYIGDVLSYEQSQLLTQKDKMSGALYSLKYYINATDTAISNVARYENSSTAIDKYNTR